MRNISLCVNEKQSCNPYFSRDDLRKCWFRLRSKCFLHHNPSFFPWCDSFHPEQLVQETILFTWRISHFQTFLRKKSQTHFALNFISRRVARINYRKRILKKVLSCNLSLLCSSSGWIDARNPVKSQNYGGNRVLTRTNFRPFPGTKRDLYY